MDKSPDAFRTISEVADLLETPAHVLRFWESRFPQIRPVKRAGGRRYYRPTDVALLSGIRILLHDQGMTIRGVQKILREQGVKHVCALGGDPALLAEARDEWAVDALPAAPVWPEVADAEAEGETVIPWPGPRLRAFDLADPEPAAPEALAPDAVEVPVEDSIVATVRSAEPESPPPDTGGGDDSVLAAVALVMGDSAEPSLTPEASGQLADAPAAPPVTDAPPPSAATEPPAAPAAPAGQ